MGKSFWVILIVIILTSVGLIALVGSGDNSNPATAAEVLKVTEQDHVRGLKDAPVVLVEYSDFECPACGALYPATKQVVDNFEDKITFVYRQFPLVSIHANAMAASRAAEAASKQDKFWEMHDLLFERQNEWSGLSSASSVFERYAGELGLDMAQFRSDVSSEDVSKSINQSVSLGSKIGINSTPSYFINGERLKTPNTVDEFMSAIQAALDKAENN